MPVGFREVFAYHKALSTESRQHMFQHIALWMVFKSMFSDREIGEFRIEHAKTIVVFGGKYHIFHARAMQDVGPLVGVKLRGIELVA